MTWRCCWASAAILGAGASAAQTRQQPMSGNLVPMHLDAFHTGGARPRALGEMPQSSLAKLVGVMTDVDDTLTTHGWLDDATAAALTRLAGAGVPVVAITGRPMGWSHDFLRASPAAVHPKTA